MSEQRSKRGPGICYSFQKGECDRGDGCRYLHEVQERRKTGVCYSFQRGECNRGDRCRYLHEESRQSRRRDDVRKMSSRYSSSPSKYSRGTRYDRKKHTEDDQKQEQDQEEHEHLGWTPQPSPPGSWAAIVAAAVAKEPDGETLP